MTDDTDPELARRVVEEIADRIVADHPQHQHQILGALLVEILNAGLYSGEGELFATAVNEQLAHCAERHGGSNNGVWQLCRVLFTAVKGGTPTTLH